MELDDLFKKNRHDGAADQSTLQLSDTRKSRLTAGQNSRVLV